MPDLDNSDFAQVPAITVEQPGYLGNRIIRYFVAKALAERLGGATVANFDFPEWGFSLPPVDPLRYRKTILIERIEQLDFDAIADEAAAEPSLHVVIRHFLQRQELFLPREAYLATFPIVTDVPHFGDDDLVINIRTGDVLEGAVEWYPLMPIGFYRWIVDLTGLNPVFVGQLDAGPYVDQLRASFPNARFLPSGGPMVDFDTLRRARNIVPAISTFSLVAAWLSDARRVFLPLNGFLNPAHLPAVDLIPIEDQRYLFFLFPLNHALPQTQALAHHARMEGMWREISRNQLRMIKSSAPFIPSRVAAPESTSWPNFDATRYLHTHLDAAMEISEGWYASALEHFLDIGRKRGYTSGSVDTVMNMPNLALNKRAWQSTISEWSRGKTISEDAMRAVSGDRRKDYGFHTALENFPWWIVDLGIICLVREIHIYNRVGHASVRQRALPMLIHVSSDGETWADLCHLQQGDAFGTEAGEPVPLIVRGAGVKTRYVRLVADSHNTCFHLAEVEVYGLP